MEVILKKTKITSSILKQALRSTSIDLSVGEILGWCVYGKFGKYIVCYRSDTKGLSIYPMFKDIDSAHVENNAYTVQVKLGGNYIPLKYACTDENVKNNFVEILKKAKHTAETRGQFFI